MSLGLENKQIIISEKIQDRKTFNLQSYAV